MSPFWKISDLHDSTIIFVKYFTEMFAPLFTTKCAHVVRIQKSAAGSGWEPSGSTKEKHRVATPSIKSGEILLQMLEIVRRYCWDFVLKNTHADITSRIRSARVRKQRARRLKIHLPSQSK